MPQRITLQGERTPQNQARPAMAGSDHSDLTRLITPARLDARLLHRLRAADARDLAILRYSTPRASAARA